MRRKREAWPQLVAWWESSGESAAEFAGHVGTGAATLYRWRRELRRAPAAKAPALSLAKLVEVQSLLRTTDERFEVRLADGRSVGVPPSFDVEALGRLLRLLEAAR